MMAARSKNAFAERISNASRLLPPTKVARVCNLDVRFFRTVSLSIATLAVVALSPAAHSATLNTLASFNLASGTSPGGTIRLGSNLYGTTYSGGATDRGTVYSIPLTGGAPTILASFDRTTGAYPTAGLILSGTTLYGTTTEGGAGGYGTVFSIPLAGGVPTTLATFNKTNGANPQAGLTLVGSTLYGTTVSGGANNYGTVFSVPLAGGAPTTLTTFNGANGANPYAALTLSGSNLYGTTASGGATSDGTVFTIPLVGGAPTTLATFSHSVGYGLYARLTIAGGLLYGTTFAGGGVDVSGTVFSVPLTGGAPTTLAKFSGASGGHSQAGLILSGTTLYGTTSGAGNSAQLGTVFSVPLVGGVPTTLATFNRMNGAFPIAGLTLADNALYGTTSGGGADNYGTLFQITDAGIRIPADANGDNHVNFDDLVPLAQNYNKTAGQSYQDGDFTYDGAVNFDDLVILAQHYNTGTAALAGLSADASFAADWSLAQSLVPEPTWVAVVGAFVMLRRRR